MKTSDLPSEVLSILGQVQDLTQPQQGQTSIVTIAHTSTGAVAIKHAKGALNGSWLKQEYRVLTALAGLSLPIPRVREFVHRDSGVAPEHWLLMDYVPGRPLAAVLSVEKNAAKREALLRVFGQTLAAIHAAPIPKALPVFGTSWLDHMLEEAAENLEHFGVDGSPELLAHLRSDRPATVPAMLIHGDYTIDNVMVEDGQVTGVIDWAGGARGDPRYDLALAIRPQQEAFWDSRTLELQAFFEGYGQPQLSQQDYEYFTGLYEFF